MPLHSKTVRGTLGNPKTQEAIRDGKKPDQIGDPTSISSEKDDSVPLDSLPDYSANKELKNPDGKKEELPHSKRVRGTLAHSGGSEVNKSMLGDPTSLKAETSEGDGDRGAGSGGDEGGMKRAAEMRGEYEGKEKSKL
ncbi:hypothetical protein BDV96DRAFT_507731 [Lophiotrema nucula]|uniref:Uncharacterized protein n=1 Tax=Lophiotrema nucula TaxID=690887 RepID=A0A6A5YJS7_9PLEO|nr:hypothetical protein BDV96DRAFT_507731 [Lophiotrema nucula]